MNTIRYKKKQLLARLSDLEKRNNALLTMEAKSQSELVNLLIQCQASALYIGTGVETRAECSGQAVKILEDYCENLYQQSIFLSDPVVYRQIAAKTRRQLAQVANILHLELWDDKKEVVFLPYKVSMWDSLESVWLAAKADENCDAYVVPIPYYDKNPDGSFGKMHYEGAEYPDYVPITAWEEYDMDSRRPDLIFIHNPYDELNYITSVHPDFYAKKLKNYTDRLVYIPYFILADIGPDNQTDLEGMKHFCFLPGTIYADNVIVQSEAMRQIYCSEFLNEALRYRPLSDGKQLKQMVEQKFLGLGSPKTDKVHCVRKEDVDLPETWLKVIKKADGSWKKIIFYNTSVAALLNNDDRMLGKMEQVFRTFRENMDEAVLLWRPHPLMSNTIKSMRPTLWNTYSALVRNYRSENWGIYDDTSDMNRAIALSDAYYGDPSSVAELYRQTGKPVIIQDVFLCT